MAHAEPLTAARRADQPGTDLVRRAAATLLRNWRGHSTVPTATLYPHQWSWDSAFIAVGLARLSPRRAFTELITLHGAQWGDGRVPQIVFNAAVPDDAYFPGPAVWRPLPAHGPAPGVATTGLVQPPVHAAAALAVADRRPGEATDAALRLLYPRLARSHDYLFERRRVLDGLVAIVHPWESGMDNSPAWDEPLRVVDPRHAGDITALRRDLRHADADHRPTDADYLRYLGIVTAYRDRGYTDDDLPGLPFCVVDPLFCAALAWSEDALATLAGRVGADPGRHVERSRELAHQVHSRLFDPDLGCYAALDVRTGRRIARRTVAGLMPLLLPSLPPGHREALLSTLTGPAFALGAPGVRGVPSYDLTAADVDPHRYWRGPTWINTNWLLWTALRGQGEAALAERLAADLVGLVAGAGFREYFDPTTGAGLGADGFSWSAALALDVLTHRAQGGSWER